MIKLKDILNEGKQPLNEVIFYGKAKVVLTSNAKDAQMPSQYVEFNFNYVSPNFLGMGPTLVCIPKSSKDLDKIDSLGTIEYRHKEQYTIALDIEPILKKIK